MPEFFRQEIWHPLSVHFPIALLIFASLFYLIGLIFIKRFWKQAGFLLLLLGTAGAWISIITGNLADSTVAREICDPTVLESHENNAYMVGWLFSAASVLAIVDYYGLFARFTRGITILVVLLMISGSGFLAYTGHLGAKLVYQQAAGVYVPSEDCEEFAD